MYFSDDVTFSGFLLLIQTVHILEEQVSNISAAVLGDKYKFLAEELFNMLYLFIMLLIILVTTHLIIYTNVSEISNETLRIGMGVLFFSLSPAVAIIIQFVLVNAESHPLTRLLWLALPLILLSFGHVNIFAIGIYIYIYIYIHRQAKPKLINITIALYIYYYLSLFI